MREKTVSYRVIIADDERKILQLIRVLGHWEEYQIEIVDECHDGRSTLGSIRRNRPDFVISDIKMPDLDGIELIEESRREGLECLFILVSGYRHFEYARSAIALNVVDYLLKPIEEERLNKTLEKVCRQIDQMREDREEKAELKQIRLRQQQTRLQEFWKDLLSRGENSAARNLLTEEQCNRAYQTEFVPGCYQALCVVSNMNGILEHADSLFSEEITRALHHCFDGCAVCYANRDLCGYAVILNYKKENQANVREGISALYYSIRNLSEVYGAFRLNIGVSTVKENCQDLRKALREALDAEWGRLIMMRDGVLDYSQIAGLQRVNVNSIVSRQELDKIGSCVKYLRREELGDLFSGLHRRSSAYSNCYPGSMADSFYAILDAVSENVPEENRKPAKQYCYYAYMDARNFQLLMKNLYLKLEEYILAEEKKLKQKAGKPIGEAVRFIRANYAKAISAEEVAEAGNVSTAYLSRLFREELGIGFSEFLTQVRLEEAERLLADTNLSVKEIAGAVGYPDEKYFSRLFKKTTGIKPTEYRRIYG